MQEKSRRRAYHSALVTNRLEHTASIKINTVENTTESESLIRDTDMAEELMGLIKANILAEAEMSMLAQANVSIEGVILLLQKSGS